MSPAAVDRSDSSTNDNKIVRRSSIGYLPRESVIVKKSPGRSSPPEYQGPIRPSATATFSPPILSVSLRSTTSGADNLHTPPKRIRPSSLYSPPPTMLATTSKFLKPHFERSFHEWIGFHDQNSRDSGFESTASTSSSSHRSTPVDHNDAEVTVIGVSSSSSSSSTDLPSLKRQCQWDSCPNPDLDEGDELLDHILSTHVQPLESDTHKKSLEKYACRWKDCKVYCKPSRLYAWLERHVVEKHAGSRPYGCPVPGCKQRFSGRSAAERHINSHFENATDNNALDASSSTATITPIKPTKNKNLHTSNASKSSTNGCGPKKSTIMTVISTNNDDDLSPTDGGGEPENTCSAKILASTSTTVNKKRNHTPKSNLSSDPLDDKFVRDSLAYRLSLAMTNERLASSTSTTATSGGSPCRKRNSGINHNQQQQQQQQQKRQRDGDDFTFQCKVLARRRRNEDCDDDDDFEFLVDWSPGGYLPMVWMPKKMYKNSFTVANSFVSRVCGASSTTHY